MPAHISYAAPSLSASSAAVIIHVSVLRCAVPGMLAGSIKGLNLHRYFIYAGAAALCAVAMMGCAGTAPHDRGGAAPVTVIAHLDIAPLQMSNVLVYMRDYIATVEHQPGAVRIEVLRQGNHPNHFTVIETWANEAAYEAHMASPAVRAFRARVDPLLGSPHDERRFTSVGAPPAA